MKSNAAPEGLEVPLHRSLVAPMLLMGLPRTVALVLWTGVSAVAFGLRQAWVLPIGAALHALCAAAAKSDPHFFAIVVEAVKHGRRLEP
jgi:type IV secretory pathway TrbD component